MSSLVKCDEAKIVALLHDVCEDSQITLQNLLDYGFTETIVDAVGAITKRDGEDYDSYLLRLKKNPVLY